MDTESGGEDARGGGQGVRPSVPDVGEPTALGPPSRPEARLRGLIHTLPRMLAYATMAAIFGFLGGWFGQSVFQSDSPSALSPDELAAALFPEEGVTLDVRWGDIPRQLVQEGVIDLEKFKAAAERAGSPLAPDQLRLLGEGSDEPITLDADNAYFLLDVLWALGLANGNPVLTEGPIAGQGWEQAGEYASTGGWTIGKEPGPQYLAALELIRLTPEQQAIVEDVAYNAYRPCCGNMTAFPDCNHGMAALGLAELMASQGSSADEIFQALKEISPFWFPDQYHQLAVFFEQQDQEWEKVDARVVMDKEHSSAGGWRQVSAWLQQQGALGTGGPAQGGASGCAP